MAVQTKRKQAIKALRDTGNQFVDDFLSSNSDALKLRSKEPGAYWKTEDDIGFLAIKEFPSIIYSDQDDAPLIFRLRTNMYPPPAVFYHLKSPVIRNKFRLNGNPKLASEPTLELTALPEELNKFGQWTSSWLSAYHYQRRTPPEPPVPLFSWGWDEDCSQREDPLMSIGQDWRLHLYLWTAAALKAWKAWLGK